MSVETVKVAQEIYNTCKRIEKANDVLFKYAKEYAAAEKNYREALAKEILELKDQRYPATLISDLARGKVADLKFNRDLAQEKLDVAKKSVRALEVVVSGLQSIYKNQTEV